MSRIRDINREKVLDVLAENDAMSASAISKATGMHSATARRVVSELVAGGVVREHATSTHLVWSLAAQGGERRTVPASAAQAVATEAGTQRRHEERSDDDRVSAARRLLELETEIEKLKAERASILNALSGE